MKIKKTVFLLGLMLLLFCSCSKVCSCNEGGSRCEGCSCYEVNNSGTTETKEIIESTENKVHTLSLYEPITLGEYEIEIYSYSYETYATAPYDIQFVFREEKNFVRVDLMLKNVSKTEQSLRNYQSCFSLDYNDGYIYTKYYGIYLKENTIGEEWTLIPLPMAFQPLAEPTNIQLYFAVPDEVITNTEAPLGLNVMISDETAILKIR